MSHSYVCPAHGYEAVWPDSPCPGCLEKAKLLDLSNINTQESSMEKRAVVNTDKEKTAAKKVEKSLLQDKPNQQPKPPTKKDK